MGWESPPEVALSAAAGPPAQKRYQMQLLLNRTHPSGKQRLGRGGQNVEGETEIYDRVTLSHRPWLSGYATQRAILPKAGSE